MKPAESLAKTLDSARGGGKPMKRPNFTEQEDTSKAKVEEGEAEEEVSEAEGQTEEQEEPEAEQHKGE